MRVIERRTNAPPYLIVSREDAAEKIKRQIDEGKDIRDLRIRTDEDLEKARVARSKWSKYNSELLTRLFDKSTIADEYNVYFGIVGVGNRSLESRIQDFRDDMNESIERLESILQRLELIPELSSVSRPTATSTQATSKDIFIVHGSDDATKQSVARLVERLGLRAPILHEQPNAGRTIIEKFEDYFEVAYAVVLLTPDDVGASREDHPLIQNGTERGD